VNVNWYPNDPAERLAILTTFIRDPANPNLGFARALKREAGIQVALGRPDAALELVLFSDRVDGAFGVAQQPGYLLRDRYQLTDSTTGTGVPPGILEPPYAADTIPIFLDRPSNNQRLSSRGWELSLTLPEVKPIRTRLDVQAALIKSEVVRSDVIFGSPTRVSDFQLDERIPRSPYWLGATRTGQRVVATYRLVHHEPAVGFVVTVTVQHIFHEQRQDVAAADTLAFAGYVTRTGELVPVPVERRGDPEYADLRVSRSGLLLEPFAPPGDWLASLQVAKSLPFGGRLSFYAFNALDRQGRFALSGLSARPFAATRFGLELTLPLDAALGAAGVW
jgi:ferric enterobactin receptor